jgi:uncharacterized membrane protein YfhO
LQKNKKKKHPGSPVKKLPENNKPNIKTEKESTSPEDTVLPAEDEINSAEGAAPEAEESSPEEKAPEPAPPVISGKKRLLIRLAPYIITAIVSTIIGIIFFKANKIAPFGDRSVLCMDLWGQYFSMYVNNKGASFSEMFHSWNGAFGFNNFAQGAYYTNSIFLFTFRFLPYSQLVKALDIFCLMKVVLSSLTFLGMLRYRTKSNSPVFIGGAVCYGFCAYMMAFMSQFMWTDSLILAPLVVIGLDRLILEKKPLMYAVMLALTVISSFYIGFAICIFSVLYFIVNALAQLRTEKTEDGRKKLTGTKELVSSTLRFGIYSLIAGAISACITLPVALCISNTLAADAASPTKLEWYGNFTGVLQYALPGQEFFQEYKGFNIYCGILIFLLVPIYFVNKAIRPAERILNGCLMFFLTASMNCNVLNYLWHGCHFPNQLPGRWSFLFSLYAVMLSCHGIAKHEGLTLTRTIIGTIIGTELLYYTTKGLGKTQPFNIPAWAWTVFIAAAIMIMARSTLLLMLKNRKSQAAGKFSRFSAELCACVLAAFMMFDMSKNLLTVSDYEGNRGFQTSPEKGYSAEIVKQVNTGSRIKSGSDEFYRVIANSGFTFNPSMMGGYHGMSYYSSTMNGNVFKLLEFLGNRVYGDKVSTVYTVSSPVQNSLFGVKYFIDYYNNLENKLPGTVSNITATNEAGANIRTNPTSLPIAYAVSDKVLDYKVTDQIRAITAQNDLINSICGEDVSPFVRLNADSVEPITVTMTEDPDLNSQFYYKNSGEDEAVILYRYTAPKTGAYYYEHNFRAGGFHITAPGVDRQIDAYEGKFAFAGYFNEGDSILFDYRAEGVGVGCHGFDLFFFDEDKWYNTYAKLRSDGLDVTSASGTKIKGEIELPEDSLVMATVAQDGGWKVYCDGKKLSSETAASVFPCFRVPAGKHKIELRYHVPGLLPGALISLAGIAALVALTVMERRKKSDKVTDPTKN